MPKSATERLAKYQSKFDADVVSRRYTALKDLAVDKQTGATNALVAAAQAARSAMEDENIAAILSGFFQSFANMCAGLKRKYGVGATTQSEVVKAAKYWLDSAICLSTCPSVTDTYIKGKVADVMNKILANLEIPVTVSPS
jgi:hypothetical protein